jgi:hypothetical protein
MTPRELGGVLRPRLGDKAFMDLAEQITGSRVRFPGVRTCRTLVFRAALRGGAAQGWTPARIAHEVAWLGYRRSYIATALARLGLRRKNPRRVLAGRRSQRR